MDWLAAIPALPALAVVGAVVDGAVGVPAGYGLAIGTFPGRRLVLFVTLLVMIVPVSLFLAQLGLWYQDRPLAVGEESLVTLRKPTKLSCD